ncbi:hypothetical protein YC2023_068306 [Brassica napus]
MTIDKQKEHTIKPLEASTVETFTYFGTTPPIKGGWPSPKVKKRKTSESRGKCFKIWIIEDCRRLTMKREVIQTESFVYLPLEIGQLLTFGKLRIPSESADYEYTL